MNARRLLLFALAGALSAGVSLAVASPASAGNVISDPVIKVSKNFSGSKYHFGFIETALQEGQTKDFFFRVKNPTSSDGVVPLRASESDNGFRYRYFRGDRNITQKLANNNFNLQLDAGQAKKIEMLVTNRQSPPDADCGFVRNHPPTAEAGVAINGATCN
jgi:hypothetical protein